MFTITTSQTTEDFLQIIALQKSNLPTQISETEKQTQGFVTVVHSLEDLQKMHQYEANTLIKDSENLAAYVLAMTEKSANDIPILKPMFQLFESIKYQEKMLSNFTYMVVGQVCVAKNYRGQGIFDMAYEAYKQQFSAKYEICITEISVHNKRSLAAHKRVGFQVVHQYPDEFGNDWYIVVWDWQQ